MIQAERIGVYGASGSGKSTKKNLLVCGAPRLVSFDPFAEGSKGAINTSAKDFRFALVKHWTTRFNINVIPTYGREMAELHAVSLAIRDAQVATGAKVPLTFVVEEMNTAFPVTALPTQYPGFGELCSRGRHFNINLVGVSQRIAEINTRWRGNTSCFFLFRQADARDQATAARMLPQGWGAKLTALADFQYLFVKAGKVTYGTVSKPR